VTDANVAEPTVIVVVVVSVAEEAVLPNVITEVPAAAPVTVKVATPDVVVADAVIVATAVVAEEA
jgi:hypothetical protein